MKHTVLTSLSTGLYNRIHHIEVYVETVLVFFFNIEVHMSRRPCMLWCFNSSL